MLKKYHEPVFKIHYELQSPSSLGQNNTLQVGTYTGLTQRKNKNIQVFIAQKLDANHSQ